jgi:hypothetical protein
MELVCFSFFVAEPLTGCRRSFRQRSPARPPPTVFVMFARALGPSAQPSPGARSRFLGAATPLIPRARAPFLLYRAGNAAKASLSGLSPAPRAACRSGHGVPSGHLLLVLVLNSPRTQCSFFRRRCWLPVLSSWRGVRSVFPARVIEQLLFMNSWSFWCKENDAVKRRHL